MSTDGLIVQVAYPREMSTKVNRACVCSWHCRPRFDSELIEVGPVDAEQWQHSFGHSFLEESFKGFASEEQLDDFVTYTTRFLKRWSDYCNGDELGIRVSNDFHRTIKVSIDRIGSSVDSAAH